MSVEQPRLALIGCGAFAETSLMPALQRIGWMPRLFVDPIRSNALELAARRRGRGITAPDWTAVPDAFDAAVLAVPRVYNAALAAALVGNGKHSFAVAPLGASVEACNLAISAAETADAVLDVGLPRRFSQAARSIEQVIASGVLGASLRFRAREGTTRFNRRKSDCAFRKEEGGVLAELGVHTIDLVTKWFGDPVELRYFDDSRGGVESECVAICTFADGACGRIELSRLRRLPSTLRIDGDDGFVEADLDSDRMIGCSPGAVANLLASSLRTGEDAADPRLLDKALIAFHRRVETAEPADDRLRRHVAALDVVQRCYDVREALEEPWSADRASGVEPSIAPGTKVLVTGATGFIGGRLVEALVDRGASVRCVVRDFGSATRLAREAVEIQRLDLADRAAVHDSVAGVDLVFHCAYDWDSPCQNLVGAENLIAAAVEEQVKRFVHLSTFSVYQAPSQGRLTEETDESAAESGYARIKLDIERKLLSAFHDDGLPAAILQPTIVYGPFSKPWTIDQADMLRFGTVVMPDNGQGACNAVHVDDVVAAMISAATKAPALGERCLISGPEAVSWKMFYETLASGIGAAGPQYWSDQQIAGHGAGPWEKVKRLARLPRKVVARLVRLPVAGQLVEVPLRALPGPLKTLLFGADTPPPTRIPGRVHVPSPAFFADRTVVDIARARRVLDYSPAVSFPAGMASSAAYLNWARSEEVREPRSTATR